MHSTRYALPYEPYPNNLIRLYNSYFGYYYSSMYNISNKIPNLQK